ncbi:MAG: hypothetical protein MJ237_04650 [bacterium]|nr:hypothetical protein [bacterium]
MDVFCNQCGMCCKLIPVSKDEEYILRDGFQLIDEVAEDFLEKITLEEANEINSLYVAEVLKIFKDAKFCKCRFVDDNGHCMATEKCTFCREYPSTPVAIVPDGCKFLGTVFMNNEALKHRIRIIKEEIIDYQSLINAGDLDSVSYRKIIENLNRFIKKYADFGANDW